MPTDWYTLYSATPVVSHPKVGRPHRDRRKIAASRKASHRNR